MAQIKFNGVGIKAVAACVSKRVQKTSIFLLSDAASFITGTNLVIDGGVSQKLSK